MMFGVESVVVVIVGQPDVEMIAIGLNDDSVVVAVMRGEPDDCREKCRLEMDENDQPQSEPSGEPPEASDLGLVNLRHAGRELSVLLDVSSVSMPAGAAVFRAFAAAAN